MNQRQRKSDRERSTSRGRGPVDLVVVAGDVLKRPCDLLVLKHADGFYGVDNAVAERLKFDSGVPEGQKVFLTGRNIKARQVLYVGVGPLGKFRYPQVRVFGRKALELAARESDDIEVLCTTLHGPGYGLDEREAFLSLVGGLWDGIESGVFPTNLKRIEIVELDAVRAKRLKRALSEFIRLSHGRPKDLRAPLRASSTETFGFGKESQASLSSFGAQSEKKCKLFVAMPFAPKHSDIYEIAIRESCEKADLLCELVKEQAYTGDVLTQITSRLKLANGVVAVLNDANPNVFLEIGFAWGAGKPTVLIAEKGTTLPFDVQSQRCIQYTSIYGLRSLLTTELTELKAQGVFRPSTR